MVSVQSPPGRRELPYARVLLFPAILMAAATGAAVALVAEPARIAVGVCGAVATVLVIAAAAEAVRRGRQMRNLRAEHAQQTAHLHQRIAAREAESNLLGQELLPSALQRMKRGFSPREVMLQLAEYEPSFKDLPEGHREVIRSVLAIVDMEENIRDSALSSFVSIARRVQAIVHQQAKELREMEEDHGRNPEVFDDLLRIDHGNALIGRLADSVAVLGGGRPGRQWPQPVPLYSVLRGAMSRILEYPRISLDSIAKVNIRGISVEPVIHAAAELLDNATRYSPPTSKVHVNATEVQTGIAVEIEDAGVSLTDESRAKVEGMLEAAKAGVAIQDMNDSTPRLGLAIVGRLCTQFNLQCSLRASAYGGVRAVLIIPSEMLTDAPASGYAHGIGATSLPTVGPDAVEGPKRRPKKRRPTSPKIPASVPMEDEIPEVTEWTDKGLPQRRSRMKTPLSQRYAEMAESERLEREGKEDIWTKHQRQSEPEPEPEDDGPPPGMWVEAFWEGLKKDNPGVHPTDFTRNPTAYTHLLENSPLGRTDTDDEGDLK